MNRRLLLSSAALSVLLIAALHAADPPAAPPVPERPPGAKLTADVQRIDDAITVVGKRAGKQLRLELAGLQLPSEQQIPACERALRNLVQGEAVWYSGDPQEGPIYLFRAPDGLFVNVELIRQGFGVVSEEKHEHLDVFVAYAERARALRKGVWGAELSEAEPATPEQPASGDTVVYRTRTGQRYHRAECEHLKKSKIAISLKEAKKKGLTPCGSCEPPH